MGKGRHRKYVTPSPDPRCKDCLNVENKTRFRETISIPLLKKRLETWSDRNILAEIQFLELKLELLRETLSHR